MKALLVSITLALGAHGATMPLWNVILGPSEGTVPASNVDTVKWRSNLAEAMVEARQKNRPLFVTFRCLPCKQCADFDKEVLEGGADLDPLLTQFITVRLTDAAAINLGTAVNGESPNFIARPFLSWFAHKFQPGDQVKLSVLDNNGKPREVTYQLPARDR